VHVRLPGTQSGLSRNGTYREYTADGRCPCSAFSGWSGYSNLSACQVLSSSRQEYGFVLTHVIIPIAALNRESDLPQRAELPEFPRLELRVIARTTRSAGWGIRRVWICLQDVHGADAAGHKIQHSDGYEPAVEPVALVPGAQLLIARRLGPLDAGAQEAREIFDLQIGELVLVDFRLVPAEELESG
jgi:hypothetical protein